MVVHFVFGDASATNGMTMVVENLYSRELGPSALVVCLGISGCWDTERMLVRGEKRVAAVGERRSMLVSIRRPPISTYSANEYLRWAWEGGRTYLVGATTLPADCTLRSFRTG